MFLFSSQGVDSHLRSGFHSHGHHGKLSAQRTHCLAFMPKKGEKKKKIGEIALCKPVAERYCRFFSDLSARRHLETQPRLCGVQCPQCPSVDPDWQTAALCQRRLPFFGEGGGFWGWTERSCVEKWQTCVVLLFSSSPPLPLHRPWCFPTSSTRSCLRRSCRRPASPSACTAARCSVSAEGKRAQIMNAWSWIITAAVHEGGRSIRIFFVVRFVFKHAKNILSTASCDLLW